MKKSILIIVAIVLFAVSVPVQSDAAVKPLIVALDGAALSFGSAKPFLDKQKRVLVPVRFVSEKLGTDVKWTKETKTVAVSAEGLDITLVLGATKATVNGVSKDLGTQAVEKGGSVFVPLRFVSEALGRTVVWDSTNQTAHIWNLVDAKTIEKKSLTVYDVVTPLDDHVSYHYFDAKDDKLTFEDIVSSKPFKGYQFQEKNIPDLSAIAYKMVHYLVDDKGFTEAKYFPIIQGVPADLFLAYGVSEVAIENKNAYFAFSFRENAYFGSFASKKATTMLEVNGFNWNAVGIDPYIENKFRMALVALYGDIYGVQVHNWIMGLYRSNLADDNYTLQKKQFTKTFGNYQFDFEGNSDGGTSLEFLITKRG